MAIERINIISDDPIDVSYDAPQSIRVIDDSEVRVVRIVENVEAVDHIGVFSDNPNIVSDNAPSIVRIINDSEIRVVKIVESGLQGRPGERGADGATVSGSLTGSFSGSFHGNGSGLTNVISSSYSLSASYAPGALIDGATYNITASWAASASYVSSQYYATFSQSALATTWSFNHNLNYKYPIITVWNTEDEVIIPEKIFAASTSQSIVYFPVPVSGYASATVGSILPNSAGSSSGSATLPPNVVSSSLQFKTITDPFTGSFSGSFKGDGSGLTGVIATLPANIVSSSAQITYSGISGVPSNIISSSFQIASDISGSFNGLSSSFSTRVTDVENRSTFSGSFQGNGSGLTNLTLPPNLVSSSAQISYASIINVPSNIVSSSAQITYSGISSIPSGIVSSSLQFKTTTDPFTGSFSGSFKGDGSGLTNVISSSYSVSASYAPGGSSIQTIGARIQTEDAYITAGSKGYRHINSNSTIIKTRTISTVTGSINVNIRRNGTTLGNISLVNQTGSIDTALSGWTTSLLRDDLLEFYVSGSSTYITDIILFIDIQT